MPTSIPFDPSLSLGAVVAPEKLELLEQIAEAQAPAEAAREAFDAAVMSQRSLEMSLAEMANLDVDVTPLLESMERVRKTVQETGKRLVEARVESLDKVSGLRAKLPQISGRLESPIDYERSDVKPFPFANDSLQLDVQYFTYDGDAGRDESTLKAIRSFVANATSELGPDSSSNIAATASKQAAKTRDNQTLDSTLIIAATCTHSNSAVLSPLVLDVDKTVRIWNRIHPDEALPIGDVPGMQRAADAEEGKSSKTISILTAVNRGSSFVGMIHFLRQEDGPDSDAALDELLQKMEMRAKAGLWLSSINGRIGIEDGFSEEIKRALGNLEVRTTVNMNVVGVIPSITSNSVNVAVKEYLAMGAEQAEQASDADTNATVNSKIRETQEETRGVALEGERMRQIMSGLRKIDDGSDQVINVNSLMTAFDNYLAEAREGRSGAPISFFLKTLTASQIADLWLARSGESAGDDSAPARED
jgi:hypothetical protein